MVNPLFAPLDALFGRGRTLHDVCLEQTERLVALQCDIMSVYQHALFEQLRATVALSHPESRRQYLDEQRSRGQAPFRVPEDYANRAEQFAGANVVVLRPHG